MNLSGASDQKKCTKLLLVSIRWHHNCKMFFINLLLPTASSLNTPVPVYSRWPLLVGNLQVSSPASKVTAVAARVCFAVPNSYKRTIFNTSNSSGSSWICLLAATTIHVGHIMYPKSRLESLHTSGVTWGCGVWLSDGGKTWSCGGHHPKFMSQIWFCEKKWKIREWLLCTLH